MAQAPVFELPFNSDLAFQKVLAACSEVGKVEESSAVAKFIIVKARYGLNPVRARISVSSNGPESSKVEMAARGQDVWGVASRTVMDSIIAAIR
jgi:hypothetical protein